MAKRILMNATFMNKNGSESMRKFGFLFSALVIVSFLCIPPSHFAFYGGQENSNTLRSAQTLNSTGSIVLQRLAYLPMGLRTMCYNVIETDINGNVYVVGYSGFDNGAPVSIIKYSRILRFHI